MFAEMLDEEKVIIAQHAHRGGQEGDHGGQGLLDEVDWMRVSSRETRRTRSDRWLLTSLVWTEDGGGEEDYFCSSRGTRGRLQRDVYDDMEDRTASERAEHVEIDYGDGRIIKRLWALSRQPGAAHR